MADLSNDKLREAAIKLYSRSAVRHELDTTGGTWIGLHANQWTPVLPPTFYGGTYIAQYFMTFNCRFPHILGLIEKFFTNNAVF